MSLIINGLRSVVFIIVGLISLMSQPVHSQGQSIYEGKAAELVERYVRSDLFSGSVLVAHDGQALFRKSFGQADREWDIPNVPDAKFRHRLRDKTVHRSGDFATRRARKRSPRHARHAL